MPSDLVLEIGQEDGLSIEVEPAQSIVYEPMCVVIGDSWSNPSSWGARWVDKMRVALNIKPENFKNYARSGTGFLREYGMSFPQQLNNAVGEITTPRAVKYVIVIGGTNDYNHGFSSNSDYSQYASAIDGMQATINAAFPFAKSWFFFMQGCRTRQYPLTLIDRVQRHTTANVINSAWPVPFTLFEDNLHLTQEGYDRFCDFVAKCIMGGKYDLARSNLIQFGDNVTEKFPGITQCSANCKAEWDATSVRIYTYVKIDAVDEGTTVASYVPLPESLGIPIWNTASTLFTEAYSGPSSSSAHYSIIYRDRQDSNDVHVQNECGMNSHGASIETGTKITTCVGLMWQGSSFDDSL